MHTRKVYHGLDAARGIAAVAVVLFHARSYFGADAIGQSAFVAVDLFFLISGFVIAHSYEAKIPTYGTIGFMRVRLIRFGPLYWLGGVIAVAALLVGHNTRVSLWSTLAYLVFLPNFQPTLVETAPLNGPAWSLLVEVYINMLYAFLLPRLSDRVLCWVIGTAGLALLAVAVAGYDLNGGAHLSNLWVGALRVAFAFPLGVLAYRRRDRLKVIPCSPVALAFMIAVAFCVPSSPLWILTSWFFAIPLIGLCALGASKDSLIARFGRTSSYAIYALHIPAFALAIRGSHAVHVPEWAGIAVAVPAVLLTAPLIDKFFDQPARRVLAGFKRYPAASAAPVSNAPAL